MSSTRCTQLQITKTVFYLTNQQCPLIRRRMVNIIIFSSAESSPFDSSDADPSAKRVVTRNDAGTAGDGANTRSKQLLMRIFKRNNGGRSMGEGEINDN